MRLGSEIVGARLKPYSVEVNWRQTANYAAAVGDMNPFYTDDLQPGGIIAPPMFAVAVTWPLLENLHQYLDMPFLADIFRSLVHYSEHLDFFRPVRPGDRLSLKGEVSALLPHRAGTIIVIKFLAADHEGAPVFRQYTGGLLRGVICGDGGRGAGNIPTAPEVTVPAPCWEAVVPVAREAPYIYDGCTGIFFAIHTSPRFAREVGLPGIILQGTATMAYAVSQLIDREAGGDPTGVEVVAGRFTGMVFPGTSIRVQLLERRNSAGTAHLHYRVVNEQGRQAISGGYVRLKY